MKHLSILLLFCSIFGSLYCAKGLTATIRNDVPRIDPATGMPLEASDGCLRQFGDTYYLYGTRYQPCPKCDQKYCYEWGSNITWPLCGWRNTTFALYTSRDLMNWTMVSENVLPELVNHPKINNTNMAFFEPAVIYNKKNNNYVLWFVTQLHGGNGGQGVAYSSSPEGPFVIDDHDGYPVTTMKGSADVYLYQQPNGDAYIKHNWYGTSPANYVSKLSEDYRSVIQTSEPIANGTYYEGGGIFERNNTWYVMFGQGCCFCSLGGSSLVYTSPSPLGPYTYQTSINHILPNKSYTVPAQQFGVSWITTTTNEVEYWYTGMRYGSGSVKSYDSQYWTPLQFFENGTVKDMYWEDSFTVEIK
eukprot:TRINITY_DN20944_c0_g1_i1.p1 TRINITY_DN20944_c0_g1~~TRINITY_DN20944_c0_g1_i1.p1  ORF type:complete len:359 (+),score=67.08 TRINITY_DN20944_c0_g1_i1:132-1208(+)